jgi:hypothetical protein
MQCRVHNPVNWYIYKMSRFFLQLGSYIVAAVVISGKISGEVTQ